MFRALQRLLGAEERVMPVCMCVSRMPCADLCLSAVAEGSPGVQHMFIIHAFVCMERRHRGPSFLPEKVQTLESSSTVFTQM